MAVGQMFDITTDKTPVFEVKVGVQAYEVVPILHVILVAVF